MYVSFYKGLDGITGAALAGPPDFIAEARVWQRRQGGNLRSLFPYVISAREGLKQKLPRIRNYCDKARTLARELSSVEGLRITPEAPPTNMMHIHLPGDRKRLEKAAFEIAQEKKVFLFGKLQTSRFDGMCLFELAVGDATLDLPDREIRSLIEELLARCR